MEGTETLTETEVEPNTYPADICECKKAMEVFLKSNPDEDAARRIRELLGKNREEREETKYNTPEELRGKPNYYLSDDDRLYWWVGF